MFFLGDGILTAQYLQNHLPTSTLPPLATLYKVMKSSKPDFLHFSVWNCYCFVFYLSKIWAKGSGYHFEAIFIRYDKDHLSWRICDLNGKYFFSKDIIFNELVPGHLYLHSIQHISSPLPQPLSDTGPSSPWLVYLPPCLNSASPTSSLINVFEFAILFWHTFAFCSITTCLVTRSNSALCLLNCNFNHAYNKKMATYNEQLVCLCANCAAHTLLSDLVLPAIYDFQSLISATTFSDSFNKVYVFELAVIAEYKALVTYSPDSILFKTLHPFDLFKPPNHYNEAFTILMQMSGI